MSSALIPLVFLSCTSGVLAVEGGSEPADSATLDTGDTAASDTGPGEPSSVPGIAFAVVEGELAGDYLYDHEVTCEVDAGTPTISAADGLVEDARLVFTLGAVPEEGERLEDFDLEWWSPSPRYTATGDEDCALAITAPWPSLEADFSCDGLRGHGGGGMGDEVDLVSGRVVCP